MERRRPISLSIREEVTEGVLEDLVPWVLYRVGEGERTYNDGTRFRLSIQVGQSSWFPTTYDRLPTLVRVSTQNKPVVSQKILGQKDVVTDVRPGYTRPTNRSRVVKSRV